ncbi:MAG: methyltransferase domain-containing protein [Candidatus Paceibacterota bacterium]|jgi:ubiquinone/menaquinone biosynthesis C-methylase UbiE
MRNAQKEWNQIAAEYDKKIVRGDFFRKTILDPALIGEMGDVNTQKILDAGCGQGYFSKVLSDLGAHVVGIDVSDSLITIANDRYKSSNTLSFRECDMNKSLPFIDDYFDAILSNMTFMDIEHPDVALKEFVRVGKNGGSIIVSILHPIFTSGKIYTPFIEYIKRRESSFLIKQYKKQRSLEWNIPGTTHATTTFHRPLEYYINLFSKNITLSHMHELTLPNTHKENGFYKMLHTIPMFLILKGTINK